MYIQTDVTNPPETAPAPRKRSPGHSHMITVLLLLAAVLLLLLFTTVLGGEEEVEENVSSAQAETVTPQVPAWVTQDFLTVNRYSRPGTPLTAVNGIVVHYIGNPGTTAKENRDYFESLGESGMTSASSHFIIDTDGSVIQCVPLDEVAYCSNSRNADTISIEVCHLDETGEFTHEAYETLVGLLAWLSDAYGLEPDQLLRHGDVYEKMCPLYYMENPDAWEQLKADVFS